MYHAFLDGYEAMMNEGAGTETHRATQADTQAAPINIKDEPLFEDEPFLAPQAT
jgi:hypothetical protein